MDRTVSRRRDANGIPAHSRFSEGGSSEIPPQWRSPRAGISLRLLRLLLFKSPQSLTLKIGSNHSSRSRLIKPNQVIFRSLHRKNRSFCPISVKSIEMPVHKPFTHASQDCPSCLIVPNRVIFMPSGPQSRSIQVRESAHRNPQSAIRNPQSAIRRLACVPSPRFPACSGVNLC
jgi:hypothetical protein